MTVDLGSLYAAARERMSALVAGADDSAPVPATPGWTVHDVVAHVRGVVEDGLAGNMAGAPGDDWTAAQVRRGANVPMSELLAAWAAQAPTFEAFLSSPAGTAAGAAVFDVHTHEADLRHALGLPLDVPAAFLDWAVPQFVDGFHQAVAAAGLPPVGVVGPPVEVFRGRLGRRTEAEVATLLDTDDPAPYLDLWFVFGRREQSLGEAAT